MSEMPFKIATGLLAAGVAVGLMHVACVIGLHVPFDPNEGWNAYHAATALTTGSPYPPAQGYLVNNYPPLSFYLIGALAKIGGDAIVAGRFVALASFIAVVLGIDAAARQMGCSRIEALFAALLFAAWLMLTTDYVGMDDPQLLGHAIATGGLLLALRAPRTPRAMVGAAVLLAVAFFVKHNLVVLPAALAVWLFLADRRHAITFIASGIIFLLVGLGMFKAAFGISLFAQIDSARTFAAANIWSGLSNWLRFAAVPLCGAAALFALARHEREAMFCVLYAAIGTAAGVILLGGAGVDANALFDADIALALSAGVLLNRLGRSLTANVAALLYLAPASIGLADIETAWLSSDYWFHPMAEERATAAEEIALIRATPNDVLCDMQALCYWAGKPAAVDVFNMEQAFATGARNDGPLAEAIAEHRYGLIELESLDPFPLTPRIRAAIAQHYRTVRTDEGRVFFVPR
jgi:hypothetical protein